MSVAISKAVLQVGQSFAKVGLFKNGALTCSKQFYLPQEPLTPSLKKFWAENGLAGQIIVNSSYLEKILDSKLGGTVAQIVTRGFETWPILRQPVWPDYFNLNSKRQAALASQDLIFGVSERVSAEGKVLQDLKIEELEFINEKLKLMSVKRVCVNLLFSNLYPEHQEKVAKYFREQGYEVFAFLRDSHSADEMPAWRKNIMNACLSGVFSEHATDIKNSLPEGHTTEVFFLGSQGEAFLEDKNQIASSLFALPYSLSQQHKDQADQILYLGLEDWSLISTVEVSQYWQSPWGRIEIKFPLKHRLKSQPTCELVPSFWGGVDLSGAELGYEPGPMSFGRALKPMLYDLLHLNYSLEIMQNNEQGARRLNDHLSAMTKNISQLGDLSIKELSKNLIQQITFQIATEAKLKSSQFSIKNKRTLVTGFFAPLLFPQIKENWLEGELILDPHHATCEMNATLTALRTP